jgi:peptidoglycan/xylan/chitin deacetylase (PgdA/CDA1 family)
MGAAVADEVPHVEVACAEGGVKIGTLLYHDIVAQGDNDASGFPGAGPARYKLEYDEFDRHLHALREATQTPPGDIRAAWSTGQPPAWLLTFDDGGASALRIGETLAEHAWQGHFFITANRIDQAAFVTRNDIRAINELGHVIGSHSYSHPERMSRCSWGELVSEWQQSVQILSDILGEPVVTASVPAGYYSTKVARAAASVGIKALFNSEPVIRVHEADGCLVLGRFTLQRGASPEVAAAIAARRVPPRLRQFVSWNARKAAKSVGGEAYLRLRRALLSRR